MSQPQQPAQPYGVPAAQNTSPGYGPPPGSGWNPPTPAVGGYPVSPGRPAWASPAVPPTGPEHAPQYRAQPAAAQYPGQPAPQYPSQAPRYSNQAPPYPGQAAPYPGQAAPQYPGQAAPQYPSHAAPQYPSQAAPYASQHGSQHPGQAAQFGQLALAACRICGNVPAVNTTFRGHQGMLIVMRFLSNEGPFCRDCGLGVFRHMTSRTLVQGWYGYASLVITPITVLINLVRRGKVAQLPPPQPNPYAPSRPPMDPGPRLLQRPMTWIGLAIPIALLALIIVASATG